MKKLQTLLYESSKEVIEFFHNNEVRYNENKQFLPEFNFWKNLSELMLEASKLTDENELKREVLGIAQIIIDSFPICESISKSFSLALDAIQRNKNTK